SLELMTPVDYILRESKNCNMWWTHTTSCRPSAIAVSFPCICKIR
ncbi:IS481 family transposase, partial [Klebsiella pneumoniae]